MIFNEADLIKELNFKAVRSSGSGGQNVNKVASKVELHFNLSESVVLSEDEKQLIENNLQNRLTKDGILILQCEESRSQYKNKQIVIKRFLKIIDEALIIPKKRKKTKIPKAAIEKRLLSKQKHADKKANRRKPDID